MASEEEANLARDEHSDYLRDLGAHGIAVDEVKRKGEKSFAVIAMFEKLPASVPQTLVVKRGKKTVTVPLVPQVVERFRPE